MIAGNRVCAQSTNADRLSKLTYRLPCHMRRALDLKFIPDRLPIVEILLGGASWNQRNRHAHCHSFRQLLTCEPLSLGASVWSRKSARSSRKSGDAPDP